MNDVNLPQIKGENVIFASIFIYESKNWNLKDSVVLTPYDVHNILLKNIVKVKIYK